MKQYLNLVALRRESANFVHFVANSKPSFKYAFGALTLGLLLGLISPLYELLNLTASNVFNFHIWRLFTCILPEPNIILYVWNIISVYQLVTYIEPVWGLPEVIKFVAIVQAIATILIAILGLMLFAMFQAMSLFYYAPISGSSIVNICSLVALKQFLPDTVVLTTPYGRLKNGHLPLTALFGATVLWAIGLVRGTVPLQILFGLQISWTYLRFFQMPPGADHVGDDSEHFSWASLFPRRTQPVAKTISKALFTLLVALRLCKKRVEVDLNAFEPFETVDAPLTSVESRDAERKRQKALRVLNERLSAANQSKERSSSVPAPEHSHRSDDGKSPGSSMEVTVAPTTSAAGSSPQAHA
ncbi:eukaryotic integral membrane protein (DUF1751) domain-containing protein [Ditylenchus destructor]|nr:eukaryotic integral membrane protein (DUF1751) domain-containing protein [Ditylenchus destructor]